MKNMKGITLIALVITIVVLIILAGVAISLSIGENGIFNKAKYATEEYANEQAREEMEIGKYSNEIDKIVVSDRLNPEDGTDYGLVETMTNDTWMGKQIFTKTIYIEQLPNKISNTYNHNIENVEMIWINTAKSFTIISGNNYPIPHVNTSSASYQIVFSVDNSAITINSGGYDRSAAQAYITLEYTKVSE